MAVVSTTEMTTAMSTGLIERWVERLNAGDAPGCAALYDEDATLHVVFAEPVRGAAAIREMFAAYFAMAPLHCIVERLHAADGGLVVLEWRDRVGLRGVNIYEIVDGRIRAQRNYFDQLSFLRLNGLPLPAT